MKRLIALTIGLLLLLGASPTQAQTVLSSTTLSSAITSTSQGSMAVTSATGFTAPGTGATLVYALIDREVVQVRTVNGTAIGIVRGMLSTQASTHISGATVWVGPPTAYGDDIPSGQCQRTLLPSVPYLAAGRGQELSAGTIWDCVGVTTAGQWVMTAGGQGPEVLGSTVSSATSVTPTGTYFKMSGTVNPVSTIVLPAGATAGFTLQIEPTGAWVTDTAGNILIASTAVTGKVLIMTWNGAKWAPSY